MLLGKLEPDIIQHKETYSMRRRSWILIGMMDWLGKDLRIISSHQKAYQRIHRFIHIYMLRGRKTLIEVEEY